MSDERDAYFAGVMDSRGNIAMQSGGAGRRQRLRIKVKARHVWLPAAMLRYFRVGHVSRERGGFWVYKATDAGARAVLGQVYPYLLKKKKAAGLLTRRPVGSRR